MSDLRTISGDELIRRWAFGLARIATGDQSEMDLANEQEAEIKRRLDLVPIGCQWTPQVMSGDGIQGEITIYNSSCTSPYTYLNLEDRCPHCFKRVELS